MTLLSKPLFWSYFSGSERNARLNVESLNSCLPITLIVFANLIWRILKDIVLSHTEKTPQVYLNLFDSESFSVGIRPLLYVFCNVAQSVKFKNSQRRCKSPVARLLHTACTNVAKDLPCSCLFINMISCSSNN